MSDKGEYEYPAWCQMQTPLDSYEQARQAYLGNQAKKLGSEGESQLEQFNKSADSLVKGVQDLAGVDGIDCLMELAHAADFQQGKYFEMMEEHVCITFGWEAMGMLDSARERFVNLLMLLRNRQPSTRAKDFLQRVARCYLFGFDAECVVMCRAVLDLEFGDKVVDHDQVSEWWEFYETTPEGKKYKGPRPPYGMLWAKIQAAEYAGMIKETDRKAADDVRKRGSHAIHQKPYEGDAMETVHQTVQVLDALAKGKN